MSSRIRTVLAIVLAAFAAAPAGAGAAAADRAIQEPAPAGARAGGRPAVAHDARGEGRSDDPDRALPGLRRRDPDHDLEARQHPVGRRLHADAEHARGLGRHGRPLPAGGAPHAAGHPAALRDRRRARQRQRCSARPSFPHNIGLGATRDPELVRKIAEITAEETRASGPQWTFSPCICAARDDRWGRTYESFSEDPDLVIRMETAIDGFQGRRGDLADRDHVLATAEALRRRRRHRVRHRLRRLQDRPGHRDHESRGLLGRVAAPVRAGGAAITAWAA